MRREVEKVDKYKRGVIADRVVAETMGSMITTFVEDGHEFQGECKFAFAGYDFVLQVPVAFYEFGLKNWLEDFDKLVELRARFGQSLNQAVLGNITIRPSSTPPDILYIFDLVTARLDLTKAAEPTDNGDKHLIDVQLLPAMKSGQSRTISCEASPRTGFKMILTRPGRGPPSLTELVTPGEFQRGCEELVAKIKQRHEQGRPVEVRGTTFKAGDQWSTEETEDQVLDTRTVTHVTYTVPEEEDDCEPFYNIHLTKDPPVRGYGTYSHDYVGHSYFVPFAGKIARFRRLPIKNQEADKKAHQEGGRSTTPNKKVKVKGRSRKIHECVKINGEFVTVASAMK